MTELDRMALEHWQASCGGVAERTLHDLTNAVDDLTSLAHSRQGAHALRSNRQQLKDALIKLHDLYLDTEPMGRVA